MYNYQLLPEGEYVPSRAERQEDLATAIDGATWDKDFFGPDKVNHAHHRLIRIRHFQRARACAAGRLTDGRLHSWKVVETYLDARDRLIDA